MNYAYNKFCNCPRCLAADSFWPAMLVGVGILQLLDNLNAIDFHDTWPALLILWGVILLLRWSGPATNHIQPGTISADQIPPVPPASPMDTNMDAATETPYAGEGR